jgi:hypothetical protein
MLAERQTPLCTGGKTPHQEAFPISPEAGIDKPRRDAETKVYRNKQGIRTVPAAMY